MRDVVTIEGPDAAGRRAIAAAVAERLGWPLRAASEAAALDAGPCILEGERIDAPERIAARWAVCLQRAGAVGAGAPWPRPGVLLLDTTGLDPDRAAALIADWIRGDRTLDPS